MSSDSESSNSDKFYDAEDTLTSLNSTRRSSGRKTSGLRDGDAVDSGRLSVHQATAAASATMPARSPDVRPTSKLVPPVIENQIEILTGDQLSSRDQRWSRLERLRRREEEERGGGADTEDTPHDSAESSVEGIFLSGVRSLHPFKVVEPDCRSVQSDNKSMARSSVSTGELFDSRLRSSVHEDSPQALLNDPSATVVESSSIVSTRKNEVFDASKPLHEAAIELLEDDVAEAVGSPQSGLVPDIVSSTKPASPPLRPLAPPRKKKASPPSLSRQASQEETELAAASSVAVTRPMNLPSFTGEPSPPALPSPHTAVDLLTRDLEQSLLLSPSHPDYNLDKISGLNMSQACRGDYVVKPQDEDKTRGATKSEEGYSGLGRDVGDGSDVEQETGALPGYLSQDPSGSRQERLGSSRSPGVDRKSSVRSRGYFYGGSGGQRSDGHQSSGSGGHHSSGGSGGHHSSLVGSGAARVSSVKGGSGGSDRRSIAGSVGSANSEGGIIKQLGLYVRVKSDSGKKLSDQEILQQIKVKNLDTGTEMDLATAEEHLPQSINPLSLHIMRLTSEYTGTMSSSAGITSIDSDTESIISSISDFEIGAGKKRKKLSKLLGSVTKGATKAAKIISAEVKRKQRTREEKEEEKLGRLATDISTTDGVQVSSKDGAKAAALGFKRIQAHKSGPWDFENIQFGQDLSGHHSGPIWCMKFSLCGRLLATAGQDCILRIWVLRDKHGYFSNMRRRYQVEHEGITEEQVVEDEVTQGYLNSPDSQGHIFMDRPFVTYTGHTSDLLDISWSKNFFILTSSMDKTVRLWHISRKECLCVFQHIDFVTAIAFHPRNDQFFLSGSLDGKIRLWNIPDKKVALWNEVDGQTKLITAANFCQNGKFAVVGTYDGRCIFYSTDQLKYHTAIHVRSSAHSRRKHAAGRKVTGIEPMPGEDKILVTSTDSRIRLYDLRDLSLVCKYRGYTNMSSQIRACFSPDGRYICAGSENHCVFLWSTLHVPQSLAARKDRNNFYEAIRAHSAAVTCTLFAPVPELIFEAVERGREAAGRGRTQEERSGDLTATGAEGGLGMPLTGYVVISGDYDGDIKVFIKEGKRSSLPRHDR